MQRCKEDEKAVLVSRARLRLLWAFSTSQFWRLFFQAAAASFSANFSFSSSFFLHHFQVLHTDICNVHFHCCYRGRRHSLLPPVTLSSLLLLLLVLSFLLLNLLLFYFIWLLSIAPCVAKFSRDNSQRVGEEGREKRFFFPVLGAVVCLLSFYSNACGAVYGSVFFGWQKRKKSVFECMRTRLR